MSAEKPTIPRGTRDFGPEEVTKRKYIMNTIEQVFIKYGFMPIETPTMENLSTLEGKYGEEGDKLIFRVLESGDYWSNLSKDLLFLYESLIQVTKYIFVKGLVKEEDAKHPIFFQNFLKENYESICLSFNMFGLLYSPKEQKEAIERFNSKLDLIAFELCRFFNKANLYHEQSEVDIDFHFKQFVINNFDGIFNHKYITGEISEKGLRYDLTVPFARYVVMNRNEITFPFKRYQMQPVWRADKPQKGRYREFWQCDADVVGSDSLLNELDLIQIYDEAFVKLGIKNYELRINNRKILAGIAEVVKSIDYMSTIAVAIDKLDKVGEEGVLKELSQKGFSEDEITKLFAIISIKGENTYILSVLKEKLQGSQEGLKGIEELSFVVEQLQRINNKVNLKIDFSLARGLSYYTGCIFEAVSLEGSLTSSIGGGGRYDNLTGVFGLEGVSGVGISFGLDRIYDVMEELLLFNPSLNQSTTQLLFCCETEQVLKEALKALKTTRDNGIAAELYTEKVNEKKPLEKPVKYATNKKIQWLCMVKNNENQKAVLVLKNLSEGTQDELAIDEIISKVRR